jgi:hypothetical protein
MRAMAEGKSPKRTVAVLAAAGLAGLWPKASKTKLLAMLVFALLLALPASLIAQDFTYVTNNGKITITKYLGPGGVVSVPDTIDGLPVVNIGDRAFQGSSVTNVIIPSGIIDIGDSTFSYCSGLTSITIPDSVTSIRDSTFYFCFSLASIVIPRSVTNIGNGAFTFCTSLTNAEIGNSVSRIGDTAFFNCSNLTTITVPSSVINIGDDAFVGCFGLEAITVEALNPSYSAIDGVLYNKTQTTLVQCPGAKSGSYTVLDSVTQIDTHAFAGCITLTNITIGSRVVTIGVGAFTYCLNLSSVYFWGSPPTIPVGGAGLDGNSNTTIYYLPGTTGWESSLDGRPTAQWLLPNPLILGAGPSFGVQNKNFGFILSWATNISVLVEATTNLAIPVWSPLATNTLTGGSSYFSDPQWTNYPGRFYRLRSL